MKFWQAKREEKNTQLMWSSINKKLKLTLAVKYEKSLHRLLTWQSCNMILGFRKNEDFFEWQEALDKGDEQSSLQTDIDND